MFNVIVGMGIVGTALEKLISLKCDTIGVDVGVCALPDHVHTMHICYPYSDDFISEAVRYIETANPELCIIHSTVVPGTTEKISTQTKCYLAYSPIRGRHNTMLRDILKYDKFIAGINNDSGIAANAFLTSIGFTVKEFSTCRGLELAKLIETTYSGLLIAWAQEVSRFADTVEIDYFDLMHFVADIPYLPPVIFQPGYIGGKCIMGNLKLLDKVRDSSFIQCIRKSNAGVDPDDVQRYPIRLRD